MRRSVFDFAEMPAKLEKLEAELQAPEIWSDKEKVSKLGGEIKELKENLAMFERWNTFVEDAEVALEIQDSELVEESYKNLEALVVELDKFEIRLMLSGEYDEANASLTINAGAGGTDAQDWASMLEGYSFG